ncbi:hypothetical protein FSP39_006044, partial [Pinctada imbricata]
SFSIVVKRCKRLPPIYNGYHICFPVDENRYGTTCNFGCYDGFELKGGSSHLECLMNEQWSGSIPHCEKIKCKDLPPVNKPLSFTCTDGNNYRSVCTYKCDLGYDIEPGMTRVRVCSANKQWRGDAPKCRDTEPPKFSNCIGAFYNITDRNSLEGSAYWIEPSVSDNSNELIKPILAGNIKPGDKITSGVYKIRYHAQDRAGNKAFECKMKILMKVLRCSNIFATPFMNVKCPDGVRYGAKCQFECDVGTQINGTREVVCESVHDKYSEWTYGTTQPFCEMMEKCQKVPSAPKNGALACDNWLGGQLCQLQCKKGYDVKPGFPFYDMLVCDVDKGTWGPKDFLPLPDCATSILTSRGIVRHSLEYYFSGDCNDASTKKEIQTNFISALKSSLYRDSCLIYAKDCNIANVKVYCGSKKRSTTTRINFDIDVTFGNDSFKSEFSEFRRNIHTIFTSIQDSVDEGKLDIQFGQNQTLNMKAVALTGGDLELHCGGNTIPSYTSLSCIEYMVRYANSNKRAIENTRKCFNEDEGDIFSWKLFENSNGNNAFIQTPSECDDTDECLGNPCNNGDCTDEGNTFSCRCHYGFEGDTCEHNIDDCVGNACENNGTCIDGPANYTCLCQSEFTGDLCETRMVNGNWSEWLEWSDCSATCGNGTQIRKRLCNNPMPDNGGLYCEGSNVDILNCYQIPHCPVCSNLTEPNNSTLTCHESESGNINCTLECHEGFEFDQVPKPYYLCGPDTFHQWDFQTEENPLGRLPFCSAIQYGDSLSVLYKAQYENLKCDSEEKRRSTLTAIPNRVQTALRNLACFDNGLCELAAINITDCSLRQKRSTVVNTAGFQVEFRCDSNVFGTDACVHALQYAVQQLQLLAQNKSLEAQIHNSWYDIILNKTTAAGLVNCPKGSVQVSYYCVPCSEGKHMRNGICEKCETGTYQDETGQTSCKACPVGRTTVMKGSISAQECTGTTFLLHLYLYSANAFCNMLEY